MADPRLIRKILNGYADRIEKRGEDFAGPGPGLTPEQQAALHAELNAEVDQLRKDVEDSKWN